jgi:hypothetical protein
MQIWLFGKKVGILNLGGKTEVGGKLITLGKLMVS